MLSKSQYLRGLQCHKAFWLTRHRPDLQKVDNGRQAVLDSGTDVGLLAQHLFPGGVAIPLEGQTLTEQIDRTREAMAQETPVIYEATFSHDDVLVKVDILRKGAEGWEMYEVMSSTRVEGHHLDDIALQHWVLTGAGVPLSRTCLLHIDKKYTRQGDIDVLQLFTCLDLTAEVLHRQEEVADEVARQKAMLAGNEPAHDIGPHCGTPHSCNFKAHCWRHIPEQSVFSLRDRGKPNPFRLYRSGIVRLQDVPQQELRWRQKLQVNGLLRQENHVDIPKVRKFLDGLWYPLCFLDFETTYQTPVPLFDGTRPYEQIPFQFSLHVQDRPGADVRHEAFLADAAGDPQNAFMEALVEALPESACVLTYNQRFEIGTLRRLAARLPKWSPAVKTILPNIRDLMLPFAKKHIYLWAMNGSYSIKKVLPAMVPDLGYADLPISDGGMAAAAYLRIRNSADPEEIERLRRGLLDYCHLDTWGMVRILDRMRQIIDGSAVNSAVTGGNNDIRHPH